MSHDEKELVMRCKSGDKEAFCLLIEAYQSRVYNIAYGMLGNEHDAFDAAQEVFIKLYKSIGSFSEASGFYTWLYRLTYNVCLDMLRKRKRQGMFLTSMGRDKNGDDIEFQIPDSSPGLEEHVIDGETRNEVQRAILKLKSSYRIMIILRDINGFSYDEIAKMLGISAGTVKSRIRRARESLKNILLESNPELFNATGV